MTGAPLSEPAVCEEEFGNDREVDLRKIKGYQFPGIEPYAKFLFPNRNEPRQPRSRKLDSSVEDHDVAVPIIATGADYSHYKESLGMIRNMNNGVRKVYKNMKMIYFDLGLDSFQRKEVSVS